MTSDSVDDPWRGDVHDGVAAWSRSSSPAVEEGDQLRSRDSGTRRPQRRRRATPPDGVAEGPPADSETVARKILLDQLTGQARTRHELAEKLAKKLVPDEVATTLLDRFTEIGLINDESFAREWIASRQPGKGLARRALAQELRRKGIDDETAREALDEIDPADEELAARALVQRKLRSQSLSRVDDTTATRRLVGMLARKGYGAGLAFAVVREELAAADRG